MITHDSFVTVLSDDQMTLKEININILKITMDKFDVFVIELINNFLLNTVKLIPAVKGYVLHCYSDTFKIMGKSETQSGIICYEVRGVRKKTRSKLVNICSPDLTSFSQHILNCYTPTYNILKYGSFDGI